MKKPDRQQHRMLSFRCPIGLYERMQHHAQALHTNTSEFVQAALQYALGTPDALQQALDEHTTPATATTPAFSTHGTHSCST